MDTTSATGRSATDSTRPDGSAHRFRLGELTREELRRRLPSATVVVPTGSTEQHGQHLPLMTDSLMAETVALRAAELAAARADVLVASLLPFGCSHHHLAVGGALTVTQRTYIAFLVDLAESLARMGCRRLVLLNGHGGNEDPLRVVANELVYERKLPMAVAAASYWTLGREAVADGTGLPGPAPGHAGNFETSCVLALRPDLVRLDDRFPADELPRPLAAAGLVNGVPVRFPGIWEASAGVTDAAREASADAGARAIDGIVRAAADFLVAFHAQPFPSAR
ncbi:MAG: creatininase family protein [Chloroflexota bacterium]|nr:creatininase family protein [Chloroflexota bacterium]